MIRNDIVDEIVKAIKLEGKIDTVKRNIIDNLALDGTISELQEEVKEKMKEMLQSAPDDAPIDEVRRRARQALDNIQLPSRTKSIADEKAVDGKLVEEIRQTVYGRVRDALGLSIQEDADNEIDKVKNDDTTC